jgi:hypothetical protein
MKHKENYAVRTFLNLYVQQLTMISRTHPKIAEVFPLQLA